MRKTGREEALPGWAEKLRLERFLGPPSEWHMVEADILALHPDEDGEGYFLAVYDQGSPIDGGEFRENSVAVIWTGSSGVQVLSKVLETIMADKAVKIMTD